MVAAAASRISYSLASSDNFGKFYLESYGANADWSQIKEAFEHWNNAPSSAFSNNDADKLDPKVMDRIAQLVESLGKISQTRAASNSK